MSRTNFFSRPLYCLFKKFFQISENESKKLGELNNVLVVRQHNQLGDLLASTSLFRAVKETNPNVRLTVIASHENFNAIETNQYVDELFVFNKKSLFNPVYLSKLISVLHHKYDAAIVPATVSISFTSNFLARLSKAKVRIGPNSLQGEKNLSAFFFDRRVDLDWRKYPDTNVADRILDIVRPFGIDTKNYRPVIHYQQNDLISVKKFIESLKLKPNGFLIGIHVGAGKPPNRWPLDKFILLMKKLIQSYPVKFYLTGTYQDSMEIDYIRERYSGELNYFLDRSIPELAALISQSKLFISNDTGAMHVAGATETPQISIFGPTNPFNWAPIGPQKYFIRKSEFIDDVSVDDVYNLCKTVLSLK